MFTGIVEELGVVEAVEQQHDAARLTVRAPAVLADVGIGDSVAVNGCCLTVASLRQSSGQALRRSSGQALRRSSGQATGSTSGEGGDTFTADVMQETLARTALGSLAVGDRVNLERAATPSSRLGGHIVQGHVDGTGVIVAREPAEHWDLVTVSLPGRLSRYVVAKGSIAVDGVSVTVVEPDVSLAARHGRPDPAPLYERCGFTVSLIPETLARTTLGHKQVGDQVNIEVDVIAKYVERMVSTGGRGD